MIKQYFSINKEIFYDNIEKLYSSKLIILENYKKDFYTNTIILNRKNIDYPSELLKYMNDNYSNYLEKILLICSNSLFIYINRFIKEQEQFKNIHILSNNKVKPKINIQLDYLVKQVCIENSYELVELDKFSSIKLKRIIDINIIIDISNSEPILLIIK